jgi:hypothetical protein
VAFLACFAMVFLPMACANGALPGLLRAALAAFSSREAWDSLDFLDMAGVYRHGGLPDHPRLQAAVVLFRQCFSSWPPGRQTTTVTSRTRDFMSLLLCAGGLACGESNAQAHGPPATKFLDEPESDDPAARAARLSEMDAFLRRLVGRFREAKGRGNYSERLVDCTPIGTGPGVQCMNGLGSRSDTGGSTSAMLFGVDPGSLKVNYLRVNTKGIAEGGFGRLSGDTLHLKFPCTIPPDATEVISCETRLRYYTVEGSKEVTVTTMHIRRVMTRKGIVEQISTAYDWLNRQAATR